LINAYVQDGDVGCGAPGSLSWHKCHIEQIDTMKGRCDYLTEAWPDMSDDMKLEIVVHMMEISDANSH
jgi:hypothetical protein